MSKTIEGVPGSGISRELAAGRSACIRRLRYRLALSLPETPADPVAGRIGIEISLAAGARIPPIDFDPGADTGQPAGGQPQTGGGPRPGDERRDGGVSTCRVDGSPADWAHRDGHITINAPQVRGGSHCIEIGFTGPGGGLTRSPDLAYSLFVPARAHRVLPCFDQPDLKAPLELELAVPPAWQVVANAPLAGESSVSGQKRLVFAPTEPLPTYALAFAAGCLEQDEIELGGWHLAMYYRRESAAGVGANRDEIFRLHAAALDFLESYTGVAYPFAKFAFVLIPDFEFAGMEHPGAVFYREDLLLPAAHAALPALMRRAGLIAHETAHMWFGNLVTMTWFDDVWLKEVFANFMADKFLARQFPDVDHSLAFMLRHFPPASSLDRTRAAPPIRRNLDNLAHAGEHYDALVYHKAPIAMAALEQVLGETPMQAALEAYLAKYRFGNADWPALRTCIEQSSGQNLAEWSRVWIQSAGRPRNCTRIDFAGYPDYAADALDEQGRVAALDTFESSGQTRARARAWIALYEDMLEGGIEPARLLTAAVAALAAERNELLVTRIVDDLAEIYWRFLPDARRAFAAGPVERVLLIRRDEPSANSPASRAGWTRWLGRLARFALTAEALAEIESIFENRDREIDDTTQESLALTLLLRRPERTQAIVARYRAGLADARLEERFALLSRAASPVEATRDEVFRQLLEAGARACASDALRLLNDASREAQAIAYLEPGIRHAIGLQAGGDLFYPRQWLTALFSGHGSRQAADTIRDVLASGTPSGAFERLLLETADPVFRAAAIRERSSYR